VKTTAEQLAPTDAARLLMSRPPATVEPDESVRAVAQELVAGDIGAVLVAEPGAPTGLVSERDVVTIVATGGAVEIEQASEIMTTDLVTAAPGDTIAAVGVLMREAGVRHIPVRDDDGRWIGIVSMRDVLGVLLDAVDAS
jgi:CBS domain-containing protein